jgi:hypothetical protein
MRILTTTIALTFLMIGVCQADEQERGKDLVLDKSRCVSLGFAPGSTALAQCMRTAAAARADDKQRNAKALAATNARIEAENAQRAAEFNRKMQEDQAGAFAPPASTLPSAAAIPGMQCSGSGDDQSCDAQ